MSGTYGDVFRVRHRITGEIFALKQIRDEHEANGVPATAIREAVVLKQLNHPGIIRSVIIHEKLKKSILLFFFCKIYQTSQCIYHR